MAVITISRQFGAGGRTLGQMVAEELGYDFLDDIIIQEIAKKAKVSTGSVKAMERTAGGKLSQLFTKLLSSDYIDRHLGDEKGYLDEEIYVGVLTEVMTELARQDEVVLMGRGGQYILGDFENAYHFLMVSDLESRIQFMKRYYDLNPAKAEQAVMRGEKKRKNLYAKLGKHDYNEPHLYHLVINMGRVSLEKAQKLIVSLIKD